MTQKALNQQRARERSKKVNQDNLPLREMQTLFKFRDGGPGFALGYHEEKRASGLVEKGWLTSNLAIYKSRYNRLGEEVIEYRSRYTITEAGKTVLHDHEKRGSRA
jgi:hypothetical protein